ncbi:YjdF family protein [Candidatus Stoquefichus massiliensis]|uniref:YjdF family protein n=1 Tax=Candidatus Stoquefichus massiliensis TaxID=1470350 RepID=UPI00047F7A8F|nr:YjdF family protein [Candidatus Stoquefichus massiliensis]
MDTISIQLTVYFDEPFWVGVFETISQHQLQVSRIVFGAEPIDEEILLAIQKYQRLKQSPSVDIKSKQQHISPKRLQRDVKKQMQQGLGTKSQMALKMQYENAKQERLQVRKERLEKKKQYVFDLKQQKKKAKHRGH